jgi:hypothetical protein
MPGKAIRRTCAALCAVSAIAWAAQAAAAGAPPTAFNWGEHLEARVKAVETKADSGQQVQLEATYSLCAKRTATGYQIGFADLLVTVGGEHVPNVVARTTGITGGLVLYANISSKGDFEGLRNFDQIQAEVRDLYRVQLPNTDPQRLEYRLAQTTTRDVLESVATRSWQSLVESWVGLRLAPGQTTKTRAQSMMVPLFGVSAQYATEVSYPTREACTSGAKTKDCARLHSVSESDPHAYDAAIEKMRAQFQGPKDTAPLSASVRDEVDLLTEPATLRPHSARWSRTLSLITGDKEHPTTRTQSDTTTMSFEYAPQAGCKPAKKTAP